MSRKSLVPDPTAARLAVAQLSSAATTFLEAPSSSLQVDEKGIAQRHAARLTTFHRIAAATTPGFASIVDAFSKNSSTADQTSGQDSLRAPAVRRPRGR